MNKRTELRLQQHIKEEIQKLNESFNIDLNWGDKITNITFTTSKSTPKFNVAIFKAKAENKGFISSMEAKDITTHIAKKIKDLNYQSKNKIVDDLANELKSENIEYELDRSFSHFGFKVTTVNDGYADLLITFKYAINDKTKDNDKNEKQKIETNKKKLEDIGFNVLKKNFTVIDNTYIPNDFNQFKIKDIKKFVSELNRAFMVVRLEDDPVLYDLIKNNSNQIKKLAKSYENISNSNIKELQTKTRSKGKTLPDLFQDISQQEITDDIINQFAITYKSSIENRFYDRLKNMRH